MMNLGAAVAVGIALGVAFERAWTERGRTPVTEVARGDRVRVVNTPLVADPSVAPERADAPPREPAAIEANRDDASLATGDDAAELAQLRGQVKELEAQVARLEAIVAANDPETKRIREIFAANELRHGALDREIAELASGDPESVADDPRRMCGLLIRLIDETGLLTAPFADETRELHPEPEAPDTVLTMHSNRQSFTEDIDGVESLFTDEQASLRFSLQLPKMPERWLGEPFALQIDWTIEEGTNQCGWMRLEIENRSYALRESGLTTEISWSLHWDRDAVNFDRKPVRGGEENFEGGPRDCAAERRLVDELFEKLRVRARG